MSWCWALERSGREHRGSLYVPGIWQWIAHVHLSSAMLYMQDHTKAKLQFF